MHPAIATLPVMPGAHHNAALTLFALSLPEKGTHANHRPKNHFQALNPKSKVQNPKLEG
jgi:hypothetical protein